MSFTLNKVSFITLSLLFILALHPVLHAQTTTLTTTQTTSQTTTQKISLEKLMEEARVALSTSHYDTAISLYTQVISHNDLQFGVLALEYLGVAREKNGQLAHAKSIYQQFLEKYPKDKSAPRVRQRLNALITAASQPKEKLRQVKTKSPQKKLEWNGFGGFSQYYRHAELKIKDNFSKEESEVDVESSLTSDLFYSLRGRSDSWDLQFRLGAGYLNDFLPNSDNQERLGELNMEIKNRTTRHALRVGRQRGNGAGLLGRFDGILSKFQFSNSYQLHLIYGYPVEYTNDVSVNDDKKVYGINLDIGPFHGWELTPFYIEQRTSSLQDRKATGLETRFFDQNKTLFTLIDYDIGFREINNILAIGSWRPGNATTITVNIDLRKSPVLLISNAIQGQPEEDIEELALRFNQEDLRDLASNRSADSTLISTGINHKLNPHWTIFSSVTLTRLSSIPASDGVEAVPGTGDEWSYDVQLISNGLLKEFDTGIYSLRYFDGSTSKRTTINLDFRYPINQHFKMSPQLRVDLRESTDDDTNQWVYKPSFKMSYRHNKKYHLELELGVEWSNRELTGGNEETSRGFFGTLAYRLDL